MGLPSSLVALIISLWYLAVKPVLELNQSGQAPIPMALARVTASSSRQLSGCLLEVANRIRLTILRQATLITPSAIYRSFL